MELFISSCPWEKSSWTCSRRRNGQRAIRLAVGNHSQTYHIQTWENRKLEILLVHSWETQASPGGSTWRRLELSQLPPCFLVCCMSVRAGLLVLNQLHQQAGYVFGRSNFGVMRFYGKGCQGLEISIV